LNSIYQVFKVGFQRCFNKDIDYKKVLFSVFQKLTKTQNMVKRFWKYTA
jgi:hypothetical protein